MALTVEAIASVDALRALAPAWDALFARAGVPLPFFTHAWAERWWAHMRQDGPAARDRLWFRAVRDGGELVAVAPLVLTERPGVGPVRARCLQFIGADPNMTEVRGVLALPERAREAHLALRESLRAEGGWDWVIWSGLREGDADPVMRHLSSRLADVPELRLALAPTWDELRGRLRANVKESLRKCYNSLKRDGKRPELRVARTWDELRPALERFLALHAARAASEAGPKHGDVFASPRCRAFLLDVCERLARADVTRVFELAIDGSIVASRIGFRFERQLYLYFSGYDPAWSKYSVMTTTVAEAIKWAIAERLDTVGLSTGRDVSKTRWSPDEITWSQGLELAGGARSRLAWAAWERARALRHDDRLRRLAARAAPRGA